MQKNFGAVFPGENVLPNGRNQLARDDRADVLDSHKILNPEEKQRGVEALGADMVASSLL